jgi:hypothetical protein
MSLIAFLRLSPTFYSPHEPLPDFFRNIVILFPV